MVRIEIEDLWVPAAAIIETGLTGDKRVIQREARYRLEQGKGVRVFSRPALLEKWLRSKGLTIADRKDLITDAGQVIPGFTRANDGLEFFVHSPFAMRSDDGEIVDRNRDALVVQATFVHSQTETKLILASDVDHEVIADIVKVTRRNGNAQRLEWHLVKLPPPLLIPVARTREGEAEDGADRAGQVALRAPGAATRPPHLLQQAHSHRGHGTATAPPGGQLLPRGGSEQIR